MHPIQEKILQLIDKSNIGKMTLRAIGEAIGEPNSPQKIKHHLDQLAKNGLIKVDKIKNIIERVKRGLVEGGKMIAVPILGSANCGEALCFGEENFQGNLYVSASLLKRVKNIFAIKAVGQSMNRAKVNGKDSITDGDYVIVDSADKLPINGDYVLSAIDGMMNIKKFYRDQANHQIILSSESTQDFAPIYIHEDDFVDYLVNGKVVQVMKQPDELSTWQDVAAEDISKDLGPMTDEEVEYYHNPNNFKKYA